MIELIDNLSQMRGIESQYTDAWGKLATVPESTKAKLLSAMGYPLEDEANLVEAINFEAQTLWQMPIDAVSIHRVNQPLVIDIRIPLLLATKIISWQITTESKQTINGQFEAVDHELIAVAHFDELEYHHYQVTLDTDLAEMGYHQLSFKMADEGLDVTQQLVIAPLSCYKQKPIADGAKVWGPSVQLYCVRSKRNWGIGDFADLQLLLQQLGAKGADFVGLNPIHALYPNNPEACSPYSPSSRRWLNPLYIAVDQVTGFKQKTVQELFQSDEFQTRLHIAKQSEHVNYTTVAELKFSTLKLIFEWFEAKGSKKSHQALDNFIEQGGESLKQLATFDAINVSLAEQGKENWGWPVWPEAFQDYHGDAVQKFVKEQQQQIRFFCYLQWLAQDQLAQCQKAAISSGMKIGIYRDLAVGVSEGSAEIWGNRDLYCVDASVGAPADVLGPQGQSWGLPPMDPEELIEQGFQPFIDLLRANMKDCGALRIDHVMALLRLWWVPKGESAKQGAYVYNPVEQLLALLCLESQRNKCLVIGEDLGTVPDGIQELLAENAVHSYRVFFFETAQDGGFYSPAHYPEQAMATLTTHDMPTLVGYWRCYDLEIGKEIGIYDDEDILKSLYDNRHKDKQRILDSMSGHGALPNWISSNVDECDMNQALNYAMQIHLAKGQSSLLCLQLEDWLQMEKPVNIPGTSDEYANWRRKLSMNLEDMFEQEHINQLFGELTQARQQGYKNT
ncbi:4-alpha-glucanotransferase [Catenovulum sp. SM1970]|uniref:4-alpha-glucanotransferase n=1 Tax=Marinifaba aquimaris TaxID=2741323 RepID=UPI001572D73B|nr:4-alpha-glucanotransferase [Marinifaba aquimaris]NTS76976.1 4-alpha-glucanotransferase [Marinifaba aquimaris]